MIRQGRCTAIGMAIENMAAFLTGPYKAPATDNLFHCPEIDNGRRLTQLPQFAEDPRSEEDSRRDRDSLPDKGRALLSSFFAVRPRSRLGSGPLARPGRCPHRALFPGPIQCMQSRFSCGI